MEYCDGCGKFIADDWYGKTVVGDNIYCNECVEKGRELEEDE